MVSVCSILQNHGPKGTINVLKTDLHHQNYGPQFQILKSPMTETSVSEAPNMPNSGGGGGCVGIFILLRITL